MPGRGYLGWLPFHSTGATRPAALVEINGEVARPGVYAFPAPPTLPEAWRRAAGPEPVPASEATVPCHKRSSRSAKGADILWATSPGSGS